MRTHGASPQNGGDDDDGVVDDDGGDGGLFIVGLLSIMVYGIWYIIYNI
jgi:hypothetical protein